MNCDDTTMNDADTRCHDATRRALCELPGCGESNATKPVRRWWVEHLILIAIIALAVGANRLSLLSVIDEFRESQAPIAASPDDILYSTTGATQDTEHTERITALEEQVQQLTHQLDEANATLRRLEALLRRDLNAEP